MTDKLKQQLLAFGNGAEPFIAHNHIKVTDLADGEATVTLHLEKDSLNRWNTPHGGVLFTMADVANGMATLTLRQESCVTVNATIDFISAAAAEETLTAVGKVRQMGGKVSFCTTEITDGTGKLIARLNSVMFFTGKALPLA